MGIQLWAMKETDKLPSADFVLEKWCNSLLQKLCRTNYVCEILVLAWEERVRWSCGPGSPAVWEPVQSASAAFWPTECFTHSCSEKYMRACEDLINLLGSNKFTILSVYITWQGGLAMKMLLITKSRIQKPLSICLLWSEGQEEIGLFSLPDLWTSVFAPCYSSGLLHYQNKHS